jgi:hypothetical protein
MELRHSGAMGLGVHDGIAYLLANEALVRGIDSITRTRFDPEQPLEKLYRHSGGWVSEACVSIVDRTESWKQRRLSPGRAATKVLRDVFTPSPGVAWLSDGHFPTFAPACNSTSKSHGRARRRIALSWMPGIRAAHQPEDRGSPTVPIHSRFVESWGSDSAWHSSSER